MQDKTQSNLVAGSLPLFFSFFHFEIPVFAKGHLQPSGIRPVTALAQKELMKIHHKLHDLD